MQEVQSCSLQTNPGFKMVQENIVMNCVEGSTQIFCAYSSWVCSQKVYVNNKQTKNVQFFSPLVWTKLTEPQVIVILLFFCSLLLFCWIYFTARMMCKYTTYCDLRQYLQTLQLLMKDFRNTCICCVASSLKDYIFIYYIHWVWAQQQDQLKEDI